MTSSPIAPLLIISLLRFIDIYSAILIVRLLLTWFPNVDWMQQVIGFLSPVTDPYLNLFRFVPPIGMLDISPILAFFALNIIRNLIANLGMVVLS